MRRITRRCPSSSARGEGVWVWDVEGRRYLDCVSAYSSLNHGHRHPRIVAALVEQAGRLTLTSRAVHNDRMGPFLSELCALARLEMALPMNTGAEAVETAIKLARKWGYRAKGVRAGSRRDRRLPQQFPRPHDDDRRLLVGSAVPRGLRPVHAGLQARRLRRSRRAARGDQAEHRRVPRRADPSRGRHHRAARRLSRRGARAMPRAQRAVRARRDSDGAGPHRQDVRVRARARRDPTC